jgi:hypothetical protein
MKLQNGVRNKMLGFNRSLEAKDGRDQRFYRVYWMVCYGIHNSN